MMVEEEKVGVEKFLEGEMVGGEAWRRRRLTRHWRRLA